MSTKQTNINIPDSMMMTETNSTADFVIWLVNSSLTILFVLNLFCLIYCLAGVYFYKKRNENAHLTFKDHVAEILSLLIIGIIFLYVSFITLGEFIPNWSIAGLIYWLICIALISFCFYFRFFIEKRRLAQGKEINICRSIKFLWLCNGLTLIIIGIWMVLVYCLNGLY